MTLERLKLAHEILNEAMFIDKPERTKLEQAIVSNADSDDIEKLRLLADIMFEMRLRRMVAIDRDCRIDRFFVSNVEYLSFVSETNLFPDFWPTTQFIGRQNRLPILGIRRSDAEKYVNWLTERARQLGHRSCCFRLPTKAEAQSIVPSHDSEDPYFRELVSQRIGTWVSDDEQIVFEDSADAVQSLTRQMTFRGEKELQRIMDYHKFIGDIIDEIDIKLDLSTNEMEKFLEISKKQSPKATLSVLPDIVETSLKQVETLQEYTAILERECIKRGLSNSANQDRVAMMNRFLIEASRLRSSRSGIKGYLDSDRTIIGELLTNTITELKWLKTMISPQLTRTRLRQPNLSRAFEQSLREVAGRPIDLDKQLPFINRLTELPIVTVEIKKVIERNHTKNYELATNELLILAEFALYRDDFGLLKDTLCTFWKIFFLIQRCLENDPLPAWEGLRLVMEIQR